MRAKAPKALKLKIGIEKNREKTKKEYIMENFLDSCYFGRDFLGNLVFDRG
jgi:hypothetical protein